MRDQKRERCQDAPRRLARSRGGRRPDEQDARAERHHRRVGQHLLEVGLAQRHERRVHRRHRAHGGQRLHPERGPAQQRRQARQQEHAGLDHRRRVQVGRDRRRSRHRVRQPEVERELRRLGEGAEQHQHDDRRVVRVSGEGLRVGQHLPQAERADGLAQDDEAGQHRQGPRAGDEQSLQGGAPGRGVLVRVADEQERGDRGEFPEDEQRDEVVGQHQAEHGQHEADEEEREPAALPIATHVLGGEQEDERADARDQQGEQQTQAVDHEVEVDALLRQPRRLPDEDLAAGDGRDQRAEPHEERDGQGDGQTHVERARHARLPERPSRLPFGAAGTMALRDSSAAPFARAEGEKSGAGERTRTADLLITNQLLYQLSYAGNPLEQVASGSRTVSRRLVQRALSRPGRDDRVLISHRHDTLL